MRLVSMREIYIIGTVHNMLPKYKEELKSVMKGILPDQVLVEIVKEDLKKQKLRKYPKEMVYAYRWAIKNKKKVDAFDAPIEIVKKSVIKKELKEAEKKLFKIINKYDWKELNKPKYDTDKEFGEIFHKLIDKKKDRLRQKKMFGNINKIMKKDGTILILTGVAHLSFFERNLKGAIFPLRK